MPAARSRFLPRFAILGIALLLCLPAVVITAQPTGAFPVADSLAAYETCGRVFPDPHAYWPSPAALPLESPWAKGNLTCRAVDFLGWQETLDGLSFLEELFPDFIEVYDLSDPAGPFADVLDFELGDGSSAGLPVEDLARERVPLYLIRVTDEADPTIPIPDREHFAYALSIHGIERAGVEGGIRAIEDLVTWASCERDGEDSAANCELEGQIPHPILETIPDESISAGEALKRSSVYFMLSNPDGWRRGDKQDAGFFYMRYNGNGVDMNRDWPTTGFTFRPYTPFSEPETRTYGNVLPDIKEQWSGAIDLHGQLVDRAFSFTLIGGSQRPYDKDRRVLRFVKGAWEDAEERLQWSTLIKPNDAPDQPEDPRMYGVQWGTIWDTINYTVTGALGDWMDSPLGLDADGIDNEMSISHLSNCGVGTCWIPEAEQLHVDGNKSLIYAMIHYRLLDHDPRFTYDGMAAWLHSPNRLTNPGSPLSTAPAHFDLPPQEGFEETIDHVGDESTHEFDVLGPADGVYNGGIRAQITWNNLAAVSASSLNEIAIDRRRGEEEDPQRGLQDDDEWVTVNSYFNQSFAYLQSGAQLDVNLPEPGRYRIRISGVAPSQFKAEVVFTEEQGWPDPGQLPYDVSNLDFFEQLRPFVESPDKLVPVLVDDVLAGTVDLRWFDTVVAADDAFLPGYAEAVAASEPQEGEEAVVVVPAPGAGERSPATSGFHEFDVEAGNAAIDIEVTSETVLDPDLYLQLQQPDGSWADVASGETGRSFIETLTFRNPPAGHYRLEVHNWAGAPGPANVTIEFQGHEAVINTSDYDDADRERMVALASGFVEGGGNLVLTDDSLRALEWMGLVPADSVLEQAVYAGYVEFSGDGGSSSTYDDPLAANVDQPGAAEGPNHRHQVSEPVPTGYAIQDPSGGDLDAHPQWGVARAAWDEAGGRVVGVVGAGDVTLGELAIGDGVVRVLGSLLPFPTDEFDHPFGLASYAVTYSGYEVLRNLLDWTNPNGAASGPPPPAPPPSSPLPTTGGAALAVLGLALAGAAGVAARRRLAASSLARSKDPRPALG